MVLPSTATLVLTSNNAVLQTTPLAASDTAWSYSGAFSVGTYTLTATVETLAGNRNTSSRVLSIGKRTSLCPPACAARRFALKNRVRSYAGQCAELRCRAA